MKIKSFVLSKLVVHHFTDDTNLLLSTKNLDTIESLISHELKLLVEWLRSNKLSLNETKTELIIFRCHWKHLLVEQNIRINNYKLKLHSHIKYLGILIDEVLSWNKQTCNFCTKLGSFCRIILYLKRPVYQYIYFYFTLMFFMIVWFGPT